jgi:flagellar motility protein MotE (MotC chaperone)
VRSPRLLPVVIFAGLALLLFKGIGLVTNGGYVLTGTTSVQAVEAGAPAAPSADGAAPKTEPTMSDTSPTITDTAPTMATTASATAHGSGAGAPAAPGGAANHAGGTTVAVATPDAAPAPAAAGAGQPPVVPAAPAGTAAGGLAPCPPASPAPAAAHGNAAPAAGGTAVVGCLPADAVPMKIDANGQMVPVASADGGSLTQDILLQRLGERRAELDKREAALNMREAIVAAAEKQMNAQAEALKTLQGQIAALSDQKKAMQDEQFTAIVKMYETMKPQDAASIFDGLEMDVLARVTKAMDPRKMSLILAKMTAARAQELTTQLAAADMRANTPVAGGTSDPNALPQIVGH